MTYYHCSPTQGLKVLEPRKPEQFEKPARVYMTTSLPMALMYGVRNFEYTYGYTKTGEIYFEEYFPNALEELYGGKTASLYICAPTMVAATPIPNEAVSEQTVAVLEEIVVPDVREALLEQERLGALTIRRYNQLSPKMLEWILHAEAEEIRKRNLLKAGGPMADYIRQHYPQSWKLAEQEQREHENTVANLTGNMV